MAGKYKRNGVLGGREPEPVRVGQSFGHWTYLRRGRGYRYRVVCVCGTEREVRSQDLRMGSSTSCGCLTGRSNLSRIGLLNTTHGTDYGSKLYRAWRNAKNRVFNRKSQKYQTYGAIGIDMDPVWAASFEAFAAYIGEPPGPEFSLDRIDVTKGYWPGNVKWSTAQEQGRNKHNTIRLTYGGLTRSLSDWCDQFGVKPSTARYRFRLGWSTEQVLFGKDTSNVSSNQRRTPRSEPGRRDYAGERTSLAGISSGQPQAAAWTS